jgi:nucleoside phosphorylase
MSPTFSELLARIPSEKRNDRVYVKLALLVKVALEPGSAIGTGDVEKELRARLRGAAPTNVSDALRKSEPDVDRVLTQTRSSRWYLTESGLASLAALLGMAATALRPEESVDGARFDVALVCALHRPEFQAVLDTFGGEACWAAGPSRGQPHIYKTTEHVCPDGTRLRMIAGAPTYMGLTATAILATQMVVTCQPRLLVAVGISAGTKTPERSYGDILVADPSIDYASGKVSFEGGTETFYPDPFPLPIDASLRTLVQEDGRTRASLDDIAREWKGKTHGKPLRVHIGPVGAGDQVVNSPQRIAEIQKNWRKLIGIEMETYALYRAAFEAPHPRPLYMSFKSVCDFAEAKSDDWQEYAAFTASRYCRSFLERNWARLSLITRR